MYLSVSTGDLQNSDFTCTPMNVLISFHTLTHRSESANVCVASDSMAEELDFWSLLSKKALLSRVKDLCLLRDRYMTLKWQHM